jgi:hypothetical protein
MFCPIKHHLNVGADRRHPLSVTSIEPVWEINELAHPLLVAEINVTDREHSSSC